MKTVILGVMLLFVGCKTAPTRDVRCVVTEIRRGDGWGTKMVALVDCDDGVSRQWNARAMVVGRCYIEELQRAPAWSKRTFSTSQCAESDGIGGWRR